MPPHTDRRPLSTAETISAALAAIVALTAIAGYLIDRSGFGVQPWIALAAGSMVAGVSVLLASRARDSALLVSPHERGGVDVWVWLGVLVFVVVMLLRMAWPALVPPGRGPDLTHHLLLVDYIEQHGHLVHDPSLDGSMGEMAHYTPAAHLLAVMSGRWFGVGGLRAFYPLVVLCAALTAGFVFLIARRLHLAVPFALSAPILLLLPAQYFLGAFTHDSFLPQAVATMFAVAMWWGLTVWVDFAEGAVAWLIAIFLAATYLSWPIFLGPALLVFLAMAMRADVPVAARRRQCVIVAAPLVGVFLLHSWNQWGWMVIVRTSGAVLLPTADSLGWLLPVLATVGAVAAFSDRRARLTVVLLCVTALQALALFVIAIAQGATTPYMALKMVYLAIHPMAVLAAFALGRIAGGSRVSETLGWMVAAALLIIARPAFSLARQIPVVDLDLYQAGRWVRANGSAGCTDYLVADAETAYWLHLAVLGNPRASARMQEIDRYDPRAAVGPWITAEGRSFAIADLRLLPDEVRSRAAVVVTFGHAAVIARRDATMKGCD